MKLGVVSDGLGERLALLAGAVPTPLFHSFMGVLLARGIRSAPARSRAGARPTLGPPRSS
jgi:hypothetical protein